ncbi:hypothetical protein V8F20_001796, partial [Naviculisporaceae sp. PSN 640]
NDDDDLRPNVIACAVVCLAISTAAVAARFYTRSVLVRAVAAEDWFALAALVVLSGVSTPQDSPMFLSVGEYSADTRPEAIAGKGRHYWVLGPDEFISQPKAGLVTTIFYQLSLACCKISIILLYIRILTYSYARIAAYFLLAIVVIINVVGFISTFTLCIPLAKLWDQSLPGKCHLEPAYMWAMVCLHIITDFLIFLIPLPVVIRMTTTLSNKIMLLGVFLLGFFVCLISILRAVWINLLLDSKDIFWDYVPITNWTTIELCTSIVCTCLIVMKPLANKIIQAIRARWRKSCGSGGSPTDTSSSSESSSTGGRPPTIGTRPTAFAQFRGVAVGSDVAGVREKESFAIPEASATDEYAAALREVAMPSPGTAKTKESISNC